MPDTNTPGFLELQAIANLFNSPLGLAVALIITVWGIWEWFVNQNTGRGIMLLVLAVALSVFPKVYQGLRADLYPIAKDIGGSGGALDFTRYTVQDGANAPSNCTGGGPC